MTWIPKDKEIEALCASDGSKRYEYFMNRVCETRRIVALYNEGWASLGDDEGNACLALWPHAVYAQKSALGEWAGYKPESVGIDEFMTEWMPELKRSKAFVAVFPLTNGSSVVVPAEDFEKHLNLELGNL